MKHFAVVQHTYSEFLGLIENQLEKRDIGFNYFRPFVGQSLPGTAVQFDALFLLGSDRPTTDRERCPWIAEELALIERFRSAGKPVVGIGFGGLLVAEAAGATPRRTPKDAARWAVACKTDAGEGDALAEAMDGRPVLVLHHGGAELPGNLAPVLVDEHGHWLAVRPDATSYGLLFRPELKPGMLEDMIMEAGRHVPDGLSELLAEARDRWDETQQTTDTAIVALVRELDLMRERRKPPIFKLNVE